MIFSHYTDIGKRELNEDFISFGSNAFVLCDGVGGETKGEVVSRFTAERLADYFENNCSDIFTQSKIQDILDLIQQEINDRLILYPEENGMGTTLAAVLLQNHKLFLIHIGDSRIYFIRSKENLFWRTTDHSVVAELILAGIITEEDSRTHPMRNRITRAIQANSKGKLTKADIELMVTIQSGDLVFACSDGILETIEESTLLEFLSNQNDSVEEKIAKIKDACQNKSMDNNSAFLIEFESEDEYSLDQKSNPEYLNEGLFIRITNDSESEFNITDPGKIEFQDPPMILKQPKRKGINILVFVFAILITIIIAAFTFSFFQRTRKSEKRNRPAHAVIHSSSKINPLNCAFKI